MMQHRSTRSKQRPDRIIFGVDPGVAIVGYAVIKQGKVKLAVTGYGKATKGQVGHMVQILLSMQRIPRPDDAADAAAVAICHAHTSALRARIAGYEVTDR